MEYPDGVERNWVSELNVGVQRELFEGFSASFNWYRRDTYDSVLRVNGALGFDDYTGFLMDNPCAADPNRGFLSCDSSGGLVPAQISVFNLNPEAAGIADDWVVQNTPTGDNFSEVYNGFETSFNARLPNGSTLFGGWVMERNVFVRCDSSRRTSTGRRGRARRVTLVTRRVDEVVEGRGASFPDLVFSTTPRSRATSCATGSWIARPISWMAGAALGGLLYQPQLVVDKGRAGGKAVPRGRPAGGT